MKNVSVSSVQSKRRTLPARAGSLVVEKVTMSGYEWLFSYYEWLFSYYK